MISQLTDSTGTNVHWVVPIVASGFFGAGLVLVFLSLLNYLIDSCEFQGVYIGCSEAMLMLWRCDIRRLCAGC